MKKPNVLVDKVTAFATRVVKAEQYLRLQKKETVLSKQFLRAGTSIGANTIEAQNAQSTPDFVHKLSIALKEAGETLYWIKLLRDGNYFTQAMFQSLDSDLTEINALLTSIIRTTKNKTDN